MTNKVLAEYVPNYDTVDAYVCGPPGNDGQRDQGAP